MPRPRPLTELTTETNIVQEYEELIQNIPASDVHPVHPPLAPWKMDELTELMKTGGWQGRPLLVMLVKTDGVTKYQGMTGSHRSEAARQAGLPTIPCIVIDRDAWQALLGGAPYGDGMEIGTGHHRLMRDALSRAHENAVAPEVKETFHAALCLIQTEMEGQQEEFRKFWALMGQDGIGEV